MGFGAEKPEWAIAIQQRSSRNAECLRQRDRNQERDRNQAAPRQKWSPNSNSVFESEREFAAFPQDRATRRPKRLEPSVAKATTEGFA